MCIKEVKALDEMGFDLNVIEDRSRILLLETGLGRLAACSSIHLQLLDILHTAAVSVTRLRYVQAENREWLSGRSTG